MSDALYYGISGLLILAILAGIAMQSRVKTAVGGNALAALATGIIIFITLQRYQLLSDTQLLIGLGLSIAVGLIGASRIKMIDMPQGVALLNGFGGGASALVGLLVFGQSHASFERITASLAIVVGFATLSGSLVAAAKLHRIISQKAIILKFHHQFTSLWLIVGTLTIALAGWYQHPSLALIGAGASLLFGYYFAIRVGGADMPITISLLNSLSGVGGAIAGMAIGDPFLVAVGGLVGSAGLLLTQIMCQAMNRSLREILLGQTAIAITKPDVDVKSQVTTNPEVSYDTVAARLQAAQNIMIVPGYGMALSQAQHAIKQISDTLVNQQKDVKYAIHPVAGRMPGHMNVLLAEVDVDYEDLLEMDEANQQFEDIDLVLVVGANDVINPAANTAADTPIYGMPILNVEAAKHVVICNFDRQPGYSGVPNTLYDQDSVSLLLGDAKTSLEALLKLL